jgi:hypothetical protein
MSPGLRVYVYGYGFRICLPTFPLGNLPYPSFTTFSLLHTYCSMFLRNLSGLKWARDKVVEMALGCVQFYTHEQFHV